MGSLQHSSHRSISWRPNGIDLDLIENDDGVMCIRRLAPSGTIARQSTSPFFQNHELPIASVRVAGIGNTSDKTAKSMIGSITTARLKYIGHKVKSDKEAEFLEIESVDDVTGIRAMVQLQVFKGTSVVRSTVTVSNVSQGSDVVVTQVASLTIGGLTQHSRNWFEDYSVMTASNGWFREAQWREHTLSSVGIDSNGILELNEGHSGSQATFGLSNRGSFSTGSHLPMGILKNKHDDDTWLWQIEHNGSWRWEIGDYKDSVYLCASGPTSTDHGWRKLLHKGESFTSVPVACCRVVGPVQTAFAAITQYRRRMRRPHTDMDTMPIIFNDYMNCLMGDPDEKKIKALIDPVVRSGAEYFVIDAGWYADDSNWWDDVGLWEPSKKRFPSGFKALLDAIRSNGLIPGLWVEPEVVGVRSVVGQQLPEHAFFHEAGQRVVERGRCQLDYRCTEVREWMNSVVHNLVSNYGVGYFKFDYNIEVVYGNDDTAGLAPGVAHLDHQRAYLSWVNELLDRYQGLVIENCSSGAQRMDYAMLGVHPLQSTSDQQDPVLYAAIAASVPSAVTPEQSATWAYPQASWSDEINAFTVINSLLGRVHLSGGLDRLNSKQLQLVAEGMQVYKEIRQDLRHAYPLWPLGFPKWHDDWVCLGMISTNTKNVIYISVWRRGGSITSVELPLQGFNQADSVSGPLSAKVIYPAAFETDLNWNSEQKFLKVTLPETVCARLIRIGPGEEND